MLSHTRQAGIRLCLVLGGLSSSRCRPPRSGALPGRTSGALPGSTFLYGVLSGGTTGSPASLTDDWELVDGYLNGPYADLLDADSATPIRPAQLSRAVAITDASVIDTNLIDANPNGRQPQGRQPHRWQPQNTRNGIDTICPDGTKAATTRAPVSQPGLAVGKRPGSSRRAPGIWRVHRGSASSMVSSGSSTPPGGSPWPCRGDEWLERSCV
jgi:hypothetical protein